MRLAHLADVHLDRAFAGASLDEAARSRQRLRDGLTRCLEVARERGCDLITIGGDLWEDENVRLDTRRFVSNQLGAAGVPVIMICGNHDRYLVGGNYERTSWPENVTIIHEPAPVQVKVGDVSIWGVSWTGTDPTADFLPNLALSGSGHHLLLIHGTAQTIQYFADGSAHCPFDPAAVRGAGFEICLAGHIHGASSKDRVVYPGSPEPLGWSETGRHTVAIVEVSDSSCDAELIDVNRHRYELIEVDCGGCRSSDEIADRIHEAIDERANGDLHARIDLQGEIDPACEVPRESSINNLSAKFAEVRLSDSTTSAYDLERLAEQETIQGIFVRGMQERIGQAAGDSEKTELLRRAIVAGLRALDGRQDVVDVV